jgi:hypothetical protein
VTCLKGGDQKGSLKPLSFLTHNHYHVVPMPGAALLGGLDDALDLPVSEIFTQGASASTRVLDCFVAYAPTNNDAGTTRL